MVIIVGGTLQSPHGARILSNSAASSDPAVTSLAGSVLFGMAMRSGETQLVLRAAGPASSV
jgi:hypothetical protein